MANSNDQSKEQTEAQLRSTRLELAVSLFSSTDGNAVLKRQLIEAICASDPVIAAILKNYDVN